MTTRVYAEGTDLQGSLREVARYCINQHRGILTPTTRQPKKPPSYVIVKCARCDDLSLQKMRPKAGVTPCKLQKYTQTKTKSTSAPHTRVCSGPVEVIEEVHPA